MSSSSSTMFSPWMVPASGSRVFVVPGFSECFDRVLNLKNGAYKGLGLKALGSMILGLQDCRLQF